MRATCGSGVALLLGITAALISSLPVAAVALPSTQLRRRLAPQPCTADEAVGLVNGQLSCEPVSCEAKYGAQYTFDSPTRLCKLEVTPTTSADAGSGSAHSDNFWDTHSDSGSGSSTQDDDIAVRDPCYGLNAKCGVHATPRCNSVLQTYQCVCDAGYTRDASSAARNSCPLFDQVLRDALESNTTRNEVGFDAEAAVPQDCGSDVICLAASRPTVAIFFGLLLALALCLCCCCFCLCRKLCKENRAERKWQREAAALDARMARMAVRGDMELYPQPHGAQRPGEDPFTVFSNPRARRDSYLLRWARQMRDAVAGPPPPRHGPQRGRAGQQADMDTPRPDTDWNSSFHGSNAVRRYGASGVSADADSAEEELGYRGRQHRARGQHPHQQHQQHQHHQRHQRVVELATGEQGNPSWDSRLPKPAAPPAQAPVPVRSAHSPIERRHYHPHGAGGGGHVLGGVDDEGLDGELQAYQRRKRGYHPAHSPNCGLPRSGCHGRAGVTPRGTTTPSMSEGLPTHVLAAQRTRPSSRRAWKRWWKRGDQRHGDHSVSVMLPGQAKRSSAAAQDSVVTQSPLSSPDAVSPHVLGRGVTAQPVPPSHDPPAHKHQHPSDPAVVDSTSARMTSRQDDGALTHRDYTHRSAMSFTLHNGITIAHPTAMRFHQPPGPQKRPQGSNCRGRGRVAPTAAAGCHEEGRGSICGSVSTLKVAAVSPASPLRGQPAGRSHQWPPAAGTSGARSVVEDIVTSIHETCEDEEDTVAARLRGRGGTGSSHSLDSHESLPHTPPASHQLTSSNSEHSLSAGSSTSRSSHSQSEQDASCEGEVASVPSVMRVDTVPLGATCRRKSIPAAPPVPGTKGRPSLPPLLLPSRDVTDDKPAVPVPTQQLATTSAEARISPTMKKLQRKGSSRRRGARGLSLGSMAAASTVVMVRTPSPQHRGSGRYFGKPAPEDRWAGWSSEHHLGHTKQQHSTCRGPGVVTNGGPSSMVKHSRVL